MRRVPGTILIVVGSGDRIFENQHLLDATEIFRKLNVHKKVMLSGFIPPFLSRCDAYSCFFVIVGVIRETRIPSSHVLLLFVLNDSGTHKR